MAVTAIRSRRVAEEGESVFVSMTDLTVSFLFIILVLLAFFATQFQPEDTIPVREHEVLERQLSEVNIIRHQLEDALAIERQRLVQFEHERWELDDRLAAAGRTIADLRALVQMLREEHDPLKTQLSKMVGPDSLTAYLEDASKAREALLERLAEQIRQRLPGIRVTVDSTDGIIRFRADELFPTGTWRIPLDSLAERVSHAVGDALAETLPCYTLSPSLDTDVACGSTLAAIETIQIEGHTDDVALGTELQNREQMRDNYDLSARRGAETLRVMTRNRPELQHFLNLRRQPVLSFAGYGETRPINQDNTDEARAQNRRIDIRFILQTPRNLLEVKEIRSQLTRHRSGLPTVVDETHP